MIGEYTCKNCKYYRNNECFGNRESKICDSFKRIPSVTEHDRVYSPAVMRSSRFANESYQRKIELYRNQDNSVKKKYGALQDFYRSSGDGIDRELKWMDRKANRILDELKSRYQNDYNILIYFSNIKVNDVIVERKYSSTLYYRWKDKKINGSIKRKSSEEEICRKSLNAILEILNLENKNVNIISNISNNVFESILGDLEKECLIIKRLNIKFKVFYCD